MYINTTIYINNITYDYKIKKVPISAHRDLILDF